MGNATTKERSEQEVQQIYQDLLDYVDSLSFGYHTDDPEIKATGADTAMLKEFYTPQDALYTIDMPKDDFFLPE